MSNITKGVMKVIQQALNKHYSAGLVEDGIYGKNTANALLKVPVLPTHWEKERTLIGMVQHTCNLEGFDAGPVDGYWGPQTDYGYGLLKEKYTTGQAPLPWRDDEGLGATPPNQGWPIQTQNELEKYYGPVGTNQTSVVVPYPLKIAWATEKTVTKFSCHEKVADSIVWVLDRVKDHYGDQIHELGLDLWGGCLNVRKMRGGSKWSTHAWGISIDWDPAHNRLRWGADKARLAKPEYETWWKLWEEKGAVSLGRARNYDWMHVQFSKVR